MHAGVAVSLSLRVLSYSAGCPHVDASKANNARQQVSRKICEGIDRRCSRGAGARAVEESKGHPPKKDLKGFARPQYAFFGTTQWWRTMGAGWRPATTTRSGQADERGTALAQKSRKSGGGPSLRVQRCNKKGEKSSTARRVPFACRCRCFPLPSCAQLLSRMSARRRQ